MYTLAQHQALVRRGAVSEGHAANTNTSRIQLHGASVRPTLTALGGILLCKSEINRGKAAPEQVMKTNFETAAGKGIYKAVTYSAPLLYPGQKWLIKFVLLVEVPGDISDHGVGVAHKAEAVLQQPKKTRKKRRAEFHMDKGTDSWLIIPKSDYIGALAADTARGGNLAMEKQLSGLGQKGLLGVGGAYRGAYI